MSSNILDGRESFVDIFFGTDQPRLQIQPSVCRVGHDRGTQLDVFVEASSGIRDDLDLDLAPLDATFRDSGKAPLHSWFPYLEGYSPRFVQRVRHKYLSNAKQIIEPFAGSGTTPIVLGQAGVACAFSEANPAMAFIAKTKLAVLRLPTRKRETLFRKLTKIARELPQKTDSAATDDSCAFPTAAPSVQASSSMKMHWRLFFGCVY